MGKIYRKSFRSSSEIPAGSGSREMDIVVNGLRKPKGGDSMSMIVSLKISVTLGSMAKY